jgi:hypothetical protein
MQFKKSKLAIFALSILLVIALAYIVIDKWQARQNAAQELLAQQAFQIGYEQAILQIMDKAVNCDVVPLYADNGNVTVNMVAVECLQQENSQSVN